MKTKEKIIKILHEHTRKIITIGENKPLIRRAIKDQTSDQILALVKQEIVEEIEKFIGETTIRGMVYDGVRSKEILDYLKQKLNR